MIELLTETPFYVWPLLAYLLFVGFKARTSHFIPAKLMVLAPFCFPLYSAYMIFSQYGVSLMLILSWALSLALGVWVGLLMVRRSPVRVDKERKRMEIPGSGWPLILILSIFAARYFLGWAYEVYPDMTAEKSFLGLEFLVATLLGIFMGRFWGYYLKSRKALGTK